MASVVAETGKDASDLPLLETSAIPVCPKEGLSVQLIHLAHPKGNAFSRRKKQCDLWEFTWGTSIMLSRLLAALPLSTLRILEVGCGSALCSLTCAMTGGESTRVVATDVVEDAVRIARLSAIANGIVTEGGTPADPRMRFERRNWEALDRDFESEEVDKYDLVIGSDVLFYRGAAPYVAKALARVLREGGIGIVGDPVRLAVDDFVECCEELNLEAQVRQFADGKATIDDVASFTSGKEAFVKLHKAKLVILRRRVVSTEAVDMRCQRCNALYTAVLAQTEPYVAEEEGMFHGSHRN